MASEMSMEELLALPVTVDVVTAGRAFGLGQEKSYELANAGEFPCRLQKIGKRWLATKADLFASLGLELPNPTAPRADSGKAIAEDGLPERVAGTGCGYVIIPLGADQLPEVLATLTTWTTGRA